MYVSARLFETLPRRTDPGLIEVFLSVRRNCRSQTKGTSLILAGNLTKNITLILDTQANYLVAPNIKNFLIKVCESSVLSGELIQPGLCVRRYFEWFALRIGQWQARNLAQLTLYGRHAGQGRVNYQKCMHN